MLIIQFCILECFNFIIKAFSYGKLNAVKGILIRDTRERDKRENKHFCIQLRRALFFW